MLKYIHDERMIFNTTHNKYVICMHFLLVTLEKRVDDVLRSKKVNNDEKEDKDEHDKICTKITTHNNDTIINLLQQIHDKIMNQKIKHDTEDYKCMHSLIVVLEGIIYDILF